MAVMENSMVIMIIFYNVVRWPIIQPTLLISNQVIVRYVECVAQTHQNLPQKTLTKMNLFPKNSNLPPTNN